MPAQQRRLSDREVRELLKGCDQRERGQPKLAKRESLEGAG